MQLMQVLPALLLSALWLGGGATACAQGEPVRDVTGTMQQPLEAADKTGTVLIFYWHDCPICNSYAPEINRLCAAHTNFAFYIVQVDPDLTPAAAQKHAKDFALRPPVLLDGKHRLVKLAGATTTPEAVVFGKNKTVLYRGRIDNLYPSLSQRRAEATERDLQDALDAITAGKPVKAQQPAMGCTIQGR
jgi:peroxiredoxin